MPSNPERDCIHIGAVTARGNLRVREPADMLRSRTFNSTSAIPSAQSLGVARLLRTLGESARQSAWHVRGYS